MARPGREPGDRGTLDIQVNDQGVVQGFFKPKRSPAPGTNAADRLLAGVKLIEVDLQNSRMTIYPTDTREWSVDFLGRKYSKIISITLPVEGTADVDVDDMLENLPSGFTKDYEYGLGFAQECDVLVNLIEDSTDCSEIELAPSGDPEVDTHVFRLSFARFDAIRAELARIKARGNGGIRRVKEWYIYNDLAGALGLDSQQLSLGRLSTSKWITRVAAGEMPLNENEQNHLLAVTVSSAAEIASRDPAKLVRLQRSIELVNLDQLITTYDQALRAGHNENWWQKFFENNIFTLQLLFGGPMTFIDAQVPVGEGVGSMAGRKIADYLLKNSITNNASLVEIKKPSTKLLRKKPYRAGLYGVQSEIGESVAQVLDQALHLTRTAAATAVRTIDSSWVANAPRCFVVAGVASELDTDDKKKSFDLYREHLAGIRLVTYDEILTQMVALRDFLAPRDIE